jgi:hypothetical protein
VGWPALSQAGLSELADSIEQESLITSALSRTELLRAAQRRDNDTLEKAREVLDSIAAITITRLPGVSPRVRAAAPTAALMSALKFLPSFRELCRVSPRQTIWPGLSQTSIRFGTRDSSARAKSRRLLRRESGRGS